MLENPRRCPCRQFSFDDYGDHIQTCQCQSAALPVHELIVYRFSLFLRSVGHRVKTHRITFAAGNERGDIEIKDYVILTRGEDDRLPPRTLVIAPQPDGALNKAARIEIRHYRQIYADSDPIVFLTITVRTSGRVYEDFARLIFLHTHREASILAGELPEESEQFRFLRASHLANLKGSVGSILTKASAIRVTIPIDLSTWSFIPLPRFFNSRRVPPLLNQSVVLIPQHLPKRHMMCVMFKALPAYCASLFIMNQ